MKKGICVAPAVKSLYIQAGKDVMPYGIQQIIRQHAGLHAGV
jgi:hypothetical protein